MARNLRSLDLGLAVAITWTHVLLTELTGGPSTTESIIMWSVVAGIVGFRIVAALRRPAHAASSGETPSSEPHSAPPATGNLPSTTAAYATETCPLVEAFAADALAEPEPTHEGTSIDWATTHSRVSSMDVYRIRLEHTLLRRPTGSDVVATTTVELTRTDERPLTTTDADTLRRTMIDRVANRLELADTFAIGPDGRFAILVEQPGTKTAQLQRIRSLVDELSQSVDLSNHHEQMSVRAGIAFADTTHRDVDTLMRHSRQVLGMTIAGDVEVFGGSVHVSRVDRFELAADLARAIRDHRLEVLYQPIVDVGTDKVSGLEALMRWHHPTRGLIGPETFIPLADEFGLSIHLHHWLTETTVSQLRSWQLAHPGLTLSVALNVSAIQLADPGIADELRRTCSRYSVSPRSIVLEVSERSITEHTKGQLVAIASMGARLSLDDFGTGSQGLADIERLPFSSVKIDRSIMKALGSTTDAEIALSIIELGGLLGLPMVAEGIERPEQAAELAYHGFDHAQGHLFARPLPLDATTGLVDQLATNGGRLSQPTALIVD
jgi:EAL domain-containing protein (putative c-di-GMP-specific phosphodiesterase class I)